MRLGSTEEWPPGVTPLGGTGMVLLSTSMTEALSKPANERVFV